MITYLIDKDKTYDEAIKQLLRAYNALHSNNKDTSSLYIYLLEGNELVGAMHVHYLWNWVSIGNMFYGNLRILKELVANAYDYYKDKAVGVKLFTTVPKRLSDFNAIGFTKTGEVALSQETYYYADLVKPIEKGHPNYTCIVSLEQNPKYEKLVNHHTSAFEISNHLNTQEYAYDIAVLDLTSCIGGIQCTVSNDMLYISRLVVKDNYRGQHIGKTLINQIIAYSKENQVKHLMLGTTQFQARRFYEANGFKVMHTRKDNPKGFESYTMVLHL